MKRKQKVIAVMGPTASGKSALALAVAARFGGEIVSCDSVQIYRGLDIGSAKPSAAEMAAVPHHMIDIKEPEETYSCADFAADAHAVIEEIASRNRLPILCGGTGLYMDRVLLDTDFSSAGEDPAYRAELERLDSDRLHEMLTAVDPSAAAAIHPHNRKRVIRALEIFHSTGETKTAWDARSERKGKSRYDAFRILLTCDREWLYERIDRRVERMLEQGLTEEARAVLPRLGKTAAGAIGYKELAPFLRGEEPLERAADRLKQATRNYAKRQLTWERVQYADAEKLFPVPADAAGEALMPDLFGQIEGFLKS